MNRERHELHIDLWCAFRRLVQSRTGRSRNADEVVRLVKELDAALRSGQYPCSATAHYLLGVIYEDEQSPVECQPAAWQEYSIALEQGDGDAAIRMANMCAQLIVRRENDGIGVHLLKRGSDCGNMEASFRYAAALYQGNGIRQNRTEAISRLKLAVRQKSLDAAVELAAIEHSAIDELAASAPCLRYLRRASSNGSAVARHYLGAALLLSKSKRGASDGMSLLREASKDGHGGSAYLLYVAYSRGVGVRLDRAAARRWLWRAWELRNLYARMAVLTCRLRGTIEPKEGLEEVAMDSPLRTWHDFRFQLFILH
ncbi:MAG: sel1 repeat family protein [Phycisphaeraceae bacterium]|nr:sel1 repeat family protein [Phycisphaeraceae bacterium]